MLLTFHDDFKAIKMIGKGSFAKVYLVESKANGKSYAVKAFTKEGVILSNKGNAKVTAKTLGFFLIVSGLVKHD